MKMNAVKVVVATAALLIPVCIDAAFQSQRHARWHYGLQMKSEESGSTPIDRRRFSTSALSSFSVFIGSTRRTSATEFDEGRPPLETAFLSGSCVIKPGATPPGDANAALYVTARPESLSSAPGSLFDMLVGNYGGKPPAVLTARYPINGGAAPYEFELSTSDLTEEGAFSTTTDKSDLLWWQNDNLIISARLDSDGVASTRDPEDLVGRISCSAKDSRSGLQIELSGRGMFGKSVTRKK